MTMIQGWQRVESDFEGWPTGLSKETKRWLIEQAVACLRAFERGSHKPPLLYQVVDFVRHSPDAPDDFKRWALLDAIYAAVERALRTVASPRYVLDEDRLESWERTQS